MAEARYVYPYYNLAGRFSGARFWNFAARSSVLLPDHEAWLAVLAEDLKATPGATVNLIGIGSSTGSDQSNEAIAQARMESVARFLRQRHPGVAITGMRKLGKAGDASIAIDPSGPSAYDRAVVVRWEGLVKNDPPAANIPVAEKPQDRLPGASTKWGLFSSSSVSVTIPGTLAAVGVSFFLFRKLDDDQTTGVYMALPAGLSISASAMLKMGDGGFFKTGTDELAKGILKGVATGNFKAVAGIFSGLDFTPLKVTNPFRHKDLNGATINIDEAMTLKYVTVYGRLPTFGDKGQITMWSTKEFFEKTGFNIPFAPTGQSDSAKALDVTLAKITGGPLVRLGFV